MKLLIRRRSLRLARLLYYGGFALVLLALPVTLVIASRANGLVTSKFLSDRYLMLFFPGAVLSVSGAAWLERLYRCPKCGARLLTRRVFGQKPLQYCGKCGTKIEVSIEPKKEADPDT